jgi:hypothetical protein
VETGTRSYRSCPISRLQPPKIVQLMHVSSFPLTAANTYLTPPTALKIKLMTSTASSEAFMFQHIPSLPDKLGAGTGLREMLGLEVLAQTEQ